MWVCTTGLAYQLVARPFLQSHTGAWAGGRKLTRAVYALEAGLGGLVWFNSRLGSRRHGSPRRGRRARTLDNANWR